MLRFDAFTPQFRSDLIRLFNSFVGSFRVGVKRYDFILLTTLTWSFLELLACENILCCIVEFVVADRTYELLTLPNLNGTE
jgi:hypothetical protein